MKVPTLVLLAGLPVAALGAGCAGNLENPERFANTQNANTGTNNGEVDGSTTGSTSAFTCVAELFAAPQDGGKCGSSGCHGVGGASANLDLISGDPETKFINAMGAAGGKCQDVKLVDPGNAENSVLYDILISGELCEGISTMPIGGFSSSDEASEARACMQTWINSLSATDSNEPNPDTDPDPDPTTTESAFTCVSEIFSTNGCTNASCHAGDTPSAGLNLASATVEADLVDADATVGGCVGNKIVAPGDPSSSALYLQVTTPCGPNQMPKGGNPELTETQKMCISDWITSLQ